MSRCDICADCGALEPTWASVNRGVLICDECCSIHRSLGRHISQTKSLKKGQWKSTQLAMVHQLVSHGANSIWEHTLLEPAQNKSGRRKPNPKDTVHPTKADFIRAKYQFLAFVNKQKNGESEDLDKQLHSSVRTGNLETSLRLLSLGADSNYFHPERGNYPLHVAAQVGQPSQVELLVVHGADPGAFDAGGRTPAEHARTACHADLADRIVECQYELTDRLAFYLCGRKPDHRSAAQHIIIPQLSDSSLDLSELAKKAKEKLMALSNHLFEELAMDVYDEVDRRENETIWLSTLSDSSLVSDRQTVPFLPVHPQFSATRNQGRQKLARFNAREFATLIIDILSDARHRQQGSVKGVRSEVLKVNSVISDDEPLYDSVASDEDYSSIGDNQSIKEERLDKAVEPRCHSTPFSSRSSSLVSLSESAADSSSSASDTTPITVEEYLDVKKTLLASQSRVTQISELNTGLQQEISLLNTMVHRLMQEKAAHSDAEDQFVDAAPGERRFRSMKHNSNRPQSMFEPREAVAGQAKTSAAEADKSSTLSRCKPSSSSVKHPGKPAAGAPLDTAEPSGHSAESDYDNAQMSEREDTVSVESVETKSVDEMVEGSTEQAQTELPKQEVVVKQTEKITKKIQQLLISAQEGKAASYKSCSEKIFRAANEMIALFPKDIVGDIEVALQLLRLGASQLVDSCQKVGDGDERLRTQRVIQCAYDIAKAAKQIVLLFN